MDLLPKLTVLFESHQVVAVAKPSGLLVHPEDRPGPTDEITCLSLVRTLCGERVYPVHRLDRQTSGVLLFARSPEAARWLGLEFREHRIEKKYVAIVRGWVAEAGLLDRPLYRLDPSGRELRDEPPQDSETRFCRLETVELPHPTGGFATSRYSAVEITPRSGRRHQIRRHFLQARHPLIGDTIYGEGRHNRYFQERFQIRRLLLHATSIGFTEPGVTEPVRVIAPLSSDLLQLWGDLGWAPHRLTHELK